jgi:hypothetical protein
MHRSGTSALTGALAAAGLQLYRPDDGVSWAESNPEHWESDSLTVYNDELLIRLDGAWDAPPDLPPGSLEALDLPESLDPSRVLQSAYPRSGPSVWKDPRLCLLLPFWRQVLPGPLAAVYVWRPALAVAQSLQRRDLIPIPDGLALWERYNRSAVAGLDGIDTFVVDYESVVDDPVASLESVLRWLRSLEQFGDRGPEWDHPAATRSISGDLRHHAPTTQESRDSPLLPEQVQLEAYLSSLEGGHRPIVAELPGQESPWTTAVLRLRGKLSAPKRELEKAVESNRDLTARLEIARREVAGVKQSTSWRLTRPLRALSEWGARRRPRPGR